MTPINDSVFKVPHPPLLGLETLATAASDRERLTYASKCIDVIQTVEFEEERIEDFFFGVCGEVSEAGLQHCFSEEELEKVYAFLEWYHLLLMGCLPDPSGCKEELDCVLKFFNLDSCLDILHSKNSKLDLTTSRFTLECLLTIMDGANEAREGHYNAFQDKVCKLLSYHSSKEVVLANIEMLLTEKPSLLFTEAISNMEQNERFRWALFISIVSQYSNELDFIELLAKQVADKEQGFPQHLQSHLIHLLAGVKKNYLMRPWACSGGTSSYGLSPILFAKLDVPGLPNWMPNGGNTCYISATLWPLYLLIGDKIKESLCAADVVDAPTSTPVGAFKAFYLKMAASESTNITAKEVSEFRKAMQIAFPSRFASSLTCGQEDAYEFLAGILQELLGLDFQVDKPDGFYILHKFKRTNAKSLEGSEYYDYTAALAPSFSPQHSHILDIPLDVGRMVPVALSELITTTRQNGQVDRNVRLYPREVLSESNVDTYNILPKHQTISVYHSEQYQVESRDLAPEYFCARIKRFSSDSLQKRNDLVQPNATLEFSCRENEQQTVPYDLVAMTIHSGTTINMGHYYTYIRHQVQGEWRIFKYDDIQGPELCVDEQKALLDVSKSGYIFYYKKRKDGLESPPQFIFPDKLQEAKAWVATNVSGSFFVDEKKGSLMAEDDPTAESKALKGLAEVLGKSVYVIDPVRDRDLLVLDNGYPIPGDSFCHGEEFSLGGIQYLFKQSDKSYVLLTSLKCPD